MTPTMSGQCDTAMEWEESVLLSDLKKTRPDFGTFSCFKSANPGTSAR